MNYLIIQEDTKFLAIEIIPDYDMNYMKITANLEIAAYELANGVTKSINILRTGRPYYLFIKSSENQIDLFKITNFKEEISYLLFLYVYEYDKKANKILESMVYYKYSYVDNKKVVSLDYSVKNNNTQYVALKLEKINDKKIDVTVDVVDGAYDLSKNVSEKVNNLRAGYIYYFFIPSTIYSSQTINITMNVMDTQPFSSLYIHELSRRQSRIGIYDKSQKIKTTKKGDELFASFIYLTTKYDTQYIAFEIRPVYNINYLTFIFDGEKCLYDLNEGIPLNITNIKAGYTYYFFISSIIYKTNLITLTMNSIDNKKPLSNAYIYEYEEKSSTNYIKKTSISIKNSIQNNEIISKASYCVEDFLTQYILLQLNPAYDLDYLTTKIDIDGGAYNLTNGIPLNLTDLKSGYSYFFFIPSTKFTNNIISLKMNSINSNPLSSVDIYEYENITNTYIKFTSQKITTKTKNDEIISSFIYTINKNDTKYIALKMTPDYDINNLTITIDVENGLFDLTNNIPLKVTNLKSGKTYNFFIESEIYHSALINLEMNYMSNQPFSRVYIYEYSTKSASKGNITQSITTLPKNNELSANFTYSIKNDDTKYMALEIQPTYDIDYLVIKIDDQKYLYQLYNGNFQNITNVKSIFTYYFIISSSLYNSISFSLTMSNNNTKPLSLVELYEYSNSKPISSNVLLSTNKSITTSTKNTELISKFIYSVNNDKTKYIGLKITPNNDLNYLAAQIIIENNKYELENEEEKAPIFSLKKEAKYYVFMQIKGEKTIKISLTMNNNIYSSPFYSIKIYDLMNYDYPTYNTHRVSLDKEDIANESGDSVISFSYDCSQSYISNLALEIIPNYDIDYLIAEFKYSYTLPTGLIVLFIIIGTIIFAFIIYCLVKRYKRRKNLALTDDALLLMS